MPRAPRLQAPSTTFHVTAHGVDDLPIYLDDADRQAFVARLGRIVARHRWQVDALCLMTTHYHLLVELSQPNLSEGMVVVNGGHARHFNERRGRRGPVFERRFSATPVVHDSHLLEAIRYVALNPVKAGLVSRPDEWPWSTYAQLVGVSKPWSFFDPARVRSLFSSDDRRAVGRVRTFVEAEQVPGTVGARH